MMSGTRPMNALFATDGTLEADFAGAMLRHLTAPGRWEVTVAMGVPTPVSLAIGLSPSSTAADRVVYETQHIQKSLAQQTVDRVARGWKADGFESKGIVLEGDVAEQLLEVVREQGFDLVAVGSGECGQLEALFLGSVSRKLVTYAEASVLVGRPRRGNGANSVREIAEKTRLDVLVAYDGSSGSKFALESLARLRTPLFGRLTVLSVEPIPYMALATDLPMVLPNYPVHQQRLADVAQSAADPMRGSAESVEVLTAFGRPSEEIARAAAELQVDLVILGASRHGAIDRFLMGSCAYETATKAPCSVLVLRAPVEFA